ncbi:MAG: proteasome-associated ATPase, partial [Actinomycetota bacterium]|nr:proteasome-associated ATPase [Actinomycetota bacterium]
MAGRDDSRDGQTNGSRAHGGDDAAELQSQLGFLEEEISTLRRKLAESPRSVRVLEERLADAQATLAGVTGQNERLVGTLKEAREQIIALREEVDRLAQPPSGYGVF